MRNRILLAALVAGAATLTAAPAGAKPIVTDEERTLLPPYCNYVEDAPGFADLATVNGWNARLGPAFRSFHHYCWGLTWLIRSNRFKITPQQRAYMLKEAVGEIQFSINRINMHHGSAGHVLLPELLTKQGQALLKLKSLQDAHDRFRAAADRNPRYWPAYLGLAETFMATNDKARARDVLNEGLSHSQDAVSLVRMLAEIEGKKPGEIKLPPPAVAKVPEAPAATEAAPPAAESSAPGGSAPESGQAAPEAAAQPAAGETTPAAKP